ncbi:DNA polymerase IV [Tumebacillus flagellatus]|uniref:DNA polymerase IV n=1 Tax=Tumebacillus flagellatus TaxID=1157490 RepID=A0A074LLX9_9BACL|nr:DNA polymerase IV [Tumebacillus flagellatus]KEO83091.1 DNA polymerase IV [Tumebacillus flagellatus]
MERDTARTILHLDMDAFFASVEQRDHPELRGKPVIIAHPAAVRGVVSTCSYEARRFGVHSAMPTARALRLCPDGIYIEPNHRKYSAVSREMMAILARYTPLIEPLSVDEAFLDVTGCRRLFGDGVTIARRIKEEIRRELQLTASVGISYNKFLAKLASDLEKPNGLVPIMPDDLEAKVHPLPITRLWGVGQKGAEQLQRLGLHTIGDVARMDVVRMRTFLGSTADHIYALAHGWDERPVVPEREAKSVGQETTFATDVRDVVFLESTLLAQCEKIARRLRKTGVEGRTVTLKLRYAPWRTITRSQTLPRATDLETPLYAAVKGLLTKCGLTREDAIRLIGVQVGNLVPKGQGSAEAEDAQAFGEQLSLFDVPAAKPAAPVVEVDPRQQELSRVVDSLKDKFGEKIVTRARLVRRDEE